MTYVDIGEFTSDYLRMVDGVVHPTSSADYTALAVEIAEAWCDGNPDLADLDEAAWMDVAHNSIAPQVEYYLL